MILNAALKLLKKYGFKVITIKELSKELKRSTQSVYYLLEVLKFTNKSQKAVGSTSSIIKNSQKCVQYGTEMVQKISSDLNIIWSDANDVSKLIKR